MCRTDLSGDGFLRDAPGQYWQRALWLITGLTLVALLLLNTFYWPIKVEELALAVAFSLLSSGVMTLILRKVRSSGPSKMPGSFMAYAFVRLLAAIAVIVGYMLITGLRKTQLLPFVIVFSVYFIVIDVLDAVYLLKVQKALRSQQ